MNLESIKVKTGELDMPVSTIITLPYDPTRTLHIDGDFLAYFAGVVENVSIVRKTIRNRISTLLEMTGSAECILHLTGHNSTKGLRYYAAKTKPYQGQRHGVKPANWHVAREYIEDLVMDNVTVKTWQTREADDGVALYSTKAEGNDAIASKDKDFRMFCGYHIDWKDFTITHVPLNAYHVMGDNDKDYGHRWFWRQMLHGDTADNITGVPMIGEKVSLKLLEDTVSNSEAFPIVMEQYEKKYAENALQAFVEHAILLWMRTDVHASVKDFLQVIPKGELYIELNKVADEAIANIDQLMREELEDDTDY